MPCGRDATDLDPAPAPATTNDHAAGSSHRGVRVRVPGGAPVGGAPVDVRALIALLSRPASTIPALIIVCSEGDFLGQSGHRPAGPGASDRLRQVVRTM